MAIGPGDLRPGMVVCDVRGRRLGHVDDVRDGHFRLATESGEEFRLSIADIFTVADDQVAMIFGGDTLKRYVLD